MSGLYGIVGKGRNTKNLNGDALRHSPVDIKSEAEGETFQIGCVSHTFYDNTLVKTDDYIISLYGEIFGLVKDSDNTLEPLEVRNAVGLNKVLERKRVDGERIGQTLDRLIAQMDGTFVIAIYDRGADKLSIYNDRWGLYPMYYMENDGVFYYSQEAKAFIDIRRLEPDYTGIAEYLTFDYCLEDRTFFKDIKYMIPAQKIEVCVGQIKKSIYWEMPVALGKKKKSKSAYVRELHDIYEESVLIRKSRKNNIIGLTGGFDSRLILAILNGKNTVTYNFGNMGSGDQVDALALAKEYGTDHHYMTFEGLNFMKDARDIVWMSDGQCPCERFYVLETAQEKAGLGGGIELSGMGGDAISGQKSNFTGLVPFMGKKMNAGRKAGNRKPIFQAVQRGRISACNSDIYGKSITSCWGELKKDFDNAISVAEEGATFGNYTMRLKLRTLERRVTMSSMWLIGQLLPIRFPVYDYRVMNFFNEVPQTYRFGQRLYIRMIQKCYPRAAACPHSETGRPVREIHAVMVDFVTVYNYIRSKLGLKKRTYNNSFGFVNDAIMESIKKGAIGSLLSSQTASDNGIFNLSGFGGTVEGLIGQAGAGNAMAMTLLKNMMHLSLMNEMFFNGKMDLIYSGK